MEQLGKRLNRVEAGYKGGYLAMVFWNAPDLKPGEWSVSSTRGEFRGTPAEVMEFLDDPGTVLYDDGNTCIVTCKEAHVTPEDVLRLFEGDEQNDRA